MLADTLFIAKNFSFEWPKIIEEAKNKDLWVNPLDVSRIINVFCLFKKRFREAIPSFVIRYSTFDILRFSV
jgi:hypothetical protein